MQANFGREISGSAESQELEMQTPRMKGFTLLEVLFVLSILGILMVIAIFHNSGYLEKAFDVSTKEDLRQAYFSAALYFADYPEGNLTMTDLEKYGFKGSPNVNIRIIDGRLKNLLIIAYHNNTGTQAYMVSQQRMSQSEPNDQGWLEPIQGWGSGTNPNAVPLDGNPLENGPQENIRPVQSYLLQACNRLTISELQQAYGAAQDYFRQNPGGDLNTGLVLADGFSPNPNINLTFMGVTPSNLSISAIYNIPGATNFMIDNSGNITSGPFNG
jgi:prepilin-type N-terminal cleavage/methylation domain-containing protein